jgi:hypothetical protein
MPSVSKKQHNFMAAVANNPKFAKKAGVSSSVGKEFLTADKGKTFKEGGTMKKSNPFMEMIAKKKEAAKGKGHSDVAKDKPMMKKVAGEAVKGHEKRLHGMKSGGAAATKMARGGGCEVKGKTKGKMVKMTKGGSC